MRQAKTGFTIVEVMIVLAVSGIMFVAAIRTLGGQNRETGFSQAVQDLSSKIQNVAAEIKTGNFNSSGDYDCDVNSSGVAGLSQASTPGSGTNDNCVVLGNAIQIVPGDNHIYIYKVIGSRTTYVSNFDSGQPATTLEEAHPVPVFPVNGKPGDADLTETYTLAAGSQILSSKVSGNPFDLVGIYSALDNGRFTSYAYPLSNSSSNIKTSALRQCIELPSTSCTPQSLTQWNLCMQSADGGRTMELRVSVSADGVTTTTKDVGCS